MAASKHSPESAVRILVENKIDMKIEREVEEEEGRVFAEERNMPYFETSAKDGINIEEMFLLLAEEMKRVRDGSKPYLNTFGPVPIQPTNYQSTCW